MKSESLLSLLSNLSQLSNVSYRGQKKEYIGSEFFRQSLPPGHCHKLSTAAEIKQQQIELQSLSMGPSRNLTLVKDCMSAFTPYWTSELPQSIEGTSDNQNEPEVGGQKKQLSIKIQQGGRETSEVHQQPSQLKSSQSLEEEDDGKSIKNETKNIPKNYGKAIIIFFEKNRGTVQKVLQQNGDNYEQLLQKLKSLKRRINTISDLRNLWEEQPESKSLRVISNTFLRKHSLHYIYNSRIRTSLCHAKYKRRLQQAILNPKDFNHIKDY